MFKVGDEHCALRANEFMCISSVAYHSQAFYGPFNKYHRDLMKFTKMKCAPMESGKKYIVLNNLQHSD